MKAFMHVSPTCKLKLAFLANLKMLNALDWFDQVKPIVQQADSSKTATTLKATLSSWSSILQVRP